MSLLQNSIKYYPDANLFLRTLLIKSEKRNIKLSLIGKFKYFSKNEFTYTYSKHNNHNIVLDIPWYDCSDFISSNTYSKPKKRIYEQNVLIWFEKLIEAINIQIMCDDVLHECWLKKNYFKPAKMEKEMEKEIPKNIEHYDKLFIHEDKIINNIIHLSPFSKRIIMFICDECHCSEREDEIEYIFYQKNGKNYFKKHNKDIKYNETKKCFITFYSHTSLNKHKKLVKMFEEIIN